MEPDQTPQASTIALGRLEAVLLTELRATLILADGRQIVCPEPTPERIVEFWRGIGLEVHAPAAVPDKPPGRCAACE